MSLEFFSGKSVFVTGHTGFKGAWLCRVLNRVGAHVTGYALEAEVGSVYDAVSLGKDLISVIGDVRDACALSDAFEKAKPEIVIHLAAQPLVLDSYDDPAYTFETNVLGTVNLLECVRKSKSVRSVVVITTDKVYKNNEWVYGYRETDALGGFDPYSASKSCAEIVCNSYSSSFLNSLSIPLSTARAGNVIGGGDISGNRIIPDCVRAASSSRPIVLRNPGSVRPYQHVLEPTFAYLLLAMRQFENLQLADCYNIGPRDIDCISTAELADIFCKKWGEGASFETSLESDVRHESNLLRLDCTKISTVLGWRPVWNVHEAVQKTVEWEKARHSSGNVHGIMDSQIDEYIRRTTL